MSNWHKLTEKRRTGRVSDQVTKSDYLITSENVLLRDSEGNIWSHGLRDFNLYGISYRLLARVRPISNDYLISHQIQKSHNKLVDQSKVSLIEWDRSSPLTGLLSIIKVCREEVKKSRAGIVFLPGVIGSVVSVLFVASKKSLIVNVVGDPETSIPQSTYSFVIRRLGMSVMTRIQRIACRNAKIIRYVTRRDLQQKYPANGKAIQFSFSDVKIHNIGQTRKSVQSTNKVDLVTVGSLDPLYKGIDFLIAAVRDLNLNGFGCHLHVIGDGLQKQRYETLANQLIPKSYTFHGQLKGSDEVIMEIKKYDIFVLASKSEGLPRAMLEAMSVGLPCVGTDILGVRELLYPQLKANPSDSKSLVDAIAKLWDPDTYYSASQHSLKIANEYLASTRDAKFKDFLWRVKDLV